MGRVKRLVYNLVRSTYDSTVRDLLPRRWIVNNGVPTRTARLLDRTRHRPDCKRGSVEALRRYVEPDDHVIVVGGGDGITAVVAARRASRVTVYEAASRMVSVVEETAELNAMADKITVKHATVGVAENVFGDDVGELTPVTDLPTCDVLDLDCEGAEEAIIDDLTIRPRVIVIETHPQYGVSIGDIHSSLSEMGYESMDLVFEHKPHVIVGVKPEVLE